MAKFNFRVVKTDTSWTAEIIRKKTAKEVVVTKKKEDFTNESDAQEWAETELKTFVTDLNARKRRASINS
jgi:hypothetical protein